MTQNYFFQPYYCLNVLQTVGLYITAIHVYYYSTIKNIMKSRIELISVLDFAFLYSALLKRITN